MRIERTGLGQHERAGRGVWSGRMSVRVAALAGAIVGCAATVVAAGVTIVHNGATCSITANGEVYSITCNSGEIARCTWSNGVPTMSCETPR